MKSALGVWLLVALAVQIGAHVAIAVSLARGGAPGRAGLAFFVPPLAPYWARQAGMKRLALAWVCALAAYALGVAVAGFT